MAAAYQAWSKSGARPASMPSHPEDVYKEAGWENWPHFLGVAKGNAGAAGRGSGGSKNEFRPFFEALSFARSLQVRSVAGCCACKLASGLGFTCGSRSIPGSPPLQLDTASPRQTWQDWSKNLGERPADVPFHPDRIYKEDGWRSWEHWLGS